MTGTPSESPETRVARNRLVPALALALLLLFAGCASMSVDSTVAADGTIETYSIEVNTSTTVYGLLTESAKDDGYDSLEESFLSDVNRSSYENVTYDEEIDGDSATISLTLTGFDPSASDSVNVTESDGKLVYEDTTFVNESAQVTDDQESYMSGLTLTYSLTMPGEITDSNADEVDGDTAEWTATGTDAMTDTRVYAESEKPSGIVDSVPGFGVTAGVVALVAGLGVLALRRR